MKYGKTKKNIVFKETDKRHAELRIRLNYDGLTQQFFFSSLITGYIEGDKDIMTYIDKIKELNKIQTIGKRAKVKKMRVEAKTNKTKMGLNPEELESIFDIIAENEKEKL